MAAEERGVLRPPQKQQGMDLGAPHGQPRAERMSRARLGYFYSRSGPAATLADVLPAADDFHVQPLVAAGRGPGA